MDGQLLFLIFLVLLSGFFSGAEIALVSLSEAKIRHMIEDDKFPNAELVERLKFQPKRLLITILIGNNLVNIGASVMATAWATEKFGDETLGIITGVLTLVVLIFGEIFPKTLAERYAKHFAMIVAPAIMFLQKALFPIVWLLEKLMVILMPPGQSDRITEDEIKAMVSVGAESGAIDKEEREYIANILDFSHTRVSEVMTPREKMEVLDHKTTVDEAVRFCLECGHSRLPVMGKGEEEVLGILNIQTLLRARQFRDADTRISDLDLNPPILIPESKNLDDLFKEFQWKRQHMAIVVNEHGSIIGLVTMEDLLEEIVGDIEDEFDEAEVLIEKLSENSWRVNAEVSLEDAKDVLDLDFDCSEYKTLRYLLLERFQKIPRRGEDIIIGDYHFFIEKMSGNKIDSVRVVKTLVEG